MTLAEALPILVPLVVLQLVLMVIALRDLVRPERHVRGDNKLAWGIVIVVGELIGPLAYLFLGRSEE